MKKYILIACAFLFLTVLQVMAQDGTRPADYYRIPKEMAIIALASREGLPVRIENANLFTTEKANRIKSGYKFRNVGTDAIKRIEVSVITNFLFRPDGGGRLEMYVDLIDLKAVGTRKSEVLAPGELKSSGYPGSENKLLPASKVKEILDQQSQLKAKFVVALVISKIEFANGKTMNFETDASDLHSLFLDGTGVR